MAEYGSGHAGAKGIPATASASVGAKNTDALIEDPYRNPKAGSSRAHEGTVDSVDRAIHDARAAAKIAGFDMDKAADMASDEREKFRRSKGLSSFAFRLDGLESAVDATSMEVDLNSMPGVEAVVVYASRMAWISAEEYVHPSELLERMRANGVEGWMTASTLRRRSERLDLQETQRRMRRHSHAKDPSRMLASTRTRGAEPSVVGRRVKNPFDSTEVLHTARELITKLRLIVAVLLGVPVVALDVVRDWQFDNWQWVSLALATPVVTWCAWPFHRALLGGLRRGLSALDGASSCAIILAYLYSLSALLFTEAGDTGWHSNLVFFTREWISEEYTDAMFLDVACGVTIFLLFGRLLSRRNQLKSKALLYVPHNAFSADVLVVRKSKKGKITKTSVAPTELRRGDDIIIPLGGWVPSDCEVVSGKSPVDMGPVGGMRRRTVVSVGDRVYAGARNQGPTLKLRVQQTGSKTRLAAMERWLCNAIQDENRFTQLANRSASLLVPWALAISIINFMGWIVIFGSWDAAMATSLSIMVAVAPVALALSAPLALRLGLARAASQGVLLRETGTIHQLALINAIVFNRVGTLTTGPMHVIGVVPAKGESSDLVLRVAAALTMESEHAVSRAIVRADREARDANAGGDSIPHWLEAGEVSVNADGSFQGVVDIPMAGDMRHVQASLWRPRDMGEVKDNRLAAATLSGGSPIIVRWKGKDRGVILIGDSFKDDAPQAVDKLEEMDIETFMLSRDMYRVARRIANSLGISTVLAGIAPNRKEATVRGLHARGNNVAMVGDRDSTMAMRAADVGVLMAGHSHLDSVSVSTADVVIMRDDVKALPEVINLTRHVRNTVDWNIWLTWGYNVLAIVLGMTGLLNPLLAPVAMLASSALIEWRCARVVRRNFDDSLLRHTHTWQGKAERMRAIRKLKKRQEMRALAREHAREHQHDRHLDQPATQAAAHMVEGKKRG